MKQWVTEIMALDPTAPERGLVKYGGPEVPGNTQEEAEVYCQENGLGYCKVIGELICEFPESFAPFASILGNEN
ncbi:hypothetical protein Q4E40_02845 [Pontibacter sp. BT731]|uniref:hypothetical protein n=1 Tax=Pontibacter coccineus TaxID=3063328 RepID=UPI0026E23EE0|nr:hypothetical protein [Pontibacter sp. BT731]MDO6389051.1 hypothetical protein [Pontibacter sp. BT731]